ncbi:MAG: site-specific integrase [Providencia sp.]|uniref:tyrosine-type recombinase/integrase n=1 Tax=Providencia sp. TaxID=589 RepID=UPI001B55999F|nr:site-specific integrase [Providencia sp.]MBP6082134.1 site-specific integrase [Providencia sp.]
MGELVLRDTVTSVLDVNNITKNTSNPATSYLLRLRSKQSQKTMRSCLSSVVKMFRGEDPFTFDWSIMDRDSVQLVLQKLILEKKTPNSINLILSAIKGVTEEARASRIIDSDTYQDIRSIRRIRGNRVGRGRSLSSSEITAIYQHLDCLNSAVSIRDAAIVSIMLGCGLRRAEVTLLDIKDINFDNNAVNIMGKGNKERTNFMPNDTLRRTRLWIETVRGDHAGAVFTRIRKNDDVTCDRITTDGLRYLIDKLVKESELESFTPHDCRRTYATKLLDLGEDLLTVREAMGHSSVATTQRYDKRGVTRLEAAARNLQY